VLEHHASYLAHRVVGTRLPPELRDDIGLELASFYHETASQLWNKMKHDPIARHARFGHSAAIPMDSEVAGEKRYYQLAKRHVAEGTVSLRATEIFSSILDDAAGEDQHYMHLSASLVRPGMSVLVPGRAILSGGPSMSFGNGHVLVGCEKDSATCGSYESAIITCKGDKGGHVARLMQFDNVEASVRGWNQELIESFVAELRLKVVGLQCEEGLVGGIRPRLMMQQVLHW